MIIFFKGQHKSLLRHLVNTEYETKDEVTKMIGMILHLQLITPPYKTDKPHRSFKLLDEVIQKMYQKFQH